MNEPSANLHPLVVALHPSHEQLPAITTWGRDIVVTAGAGAGKTRTLVARYLALLAAGAPLRSVIAITFTEKAAREMRNRVRDEVRRYLETSDLAESERSHWQGVYSGLDAARISTIHGLCAEILRSHPAEAGVDPRFNVLDEGRSNLLRQQAVDETLTWAAEKPELAPLFALLGERGLRETLAALLQRRLDASASFIALPVDDLLLHWQAILHARQEMALRAWFASPEWREAKQAICGVAALKPDDLIEVQRQIAAAIIQDVESAGADTDRLARLAQLDTINLRGGSAKVWPGGKTDLDALKAALNVLRDGWRDRQILHLALTPLDEEIAAAMPALRSAFQTAQAIYARLKSERADLDFDDLEAGALALLTTNAAVRARWQTETAALLVDEFQDTNSRQLDLVRCLTGGSDSNDAAAQEAVRCNGKLFIVGDAKQSIYRFRGADVTVFRQERERIAQNRGASISLVTSYRAHRDLIAALNALLRPVLGETADPARAWVEPFAPLQDYRQEPRPGFESPHIELHLALGSKSAGGLDRAAAALAARLAALMTRSQAADTSEEPQLHAAGEWRPAISPGDIAILCRASASFAAYENALERAGIPFLTVAGRGFYGRPEIRDLLNALAALADPTHDLALAGLLRSPAVGLSDAALFKLCEARDHAAQSPTAQSISLWRILCTSGAHATGAEATRALRAVAMITDLHNQAGRAPVADLLKSFLDLSGYRAALIAAGQTRAARNVAKLLADAHRSRLVSVNDFLNYVQELRDSGVREGEARATVEGAVQIMSVHAAKGLEFPVVVLGDMTYAPPSRRDLLIDRELGILLPQKDEDKSLPAIYHLGKLLADDQEAAESDRLLYVATTRACEKLLLSGYVTSKKEGALASLSGWLGRLSGEETLGLAEVNITVGDEDPAPQVFDLKIGSQPESRAACTLYGAAWAGDVHLDQTAAALEHPVALPPPLLAPIAATPLTADDRTAGQDRDPGQRVWRVAPAVKQPRAPAWVIGQLVHAALAAWRFPETDDHFARWAEAQARTHGLTDARQLADADRSCRRLLQRFRAHPLFATMASADRRLHEVPYSLTTADGRIENGVIDALFQNDADWTLVEFKTDRITDDAHLAGVLVEKDYLAQVERYAAAVMYLLDVRPKAILCFLDVAGEVRLCHNAGISATETGEHKHQVGA